VILHNLVTGRDQLLGSVGDIAFNKSGDLLAYTVDAAVKDAVARSALKRIGSELALTARRQRALERRWLPALTAARKQLNGALDELEREEATRAVWAQRRQRTSAL